MHISAVNICNYRNFSSLSLEDLPAAIVLLGENNTGKSNLLRAIQLVLDPGLPDRARQLDRDDFWLGCSAPMSGDEIVVALELTDYRSDVRVKAALADCSVKQSPLTARLTYTFRPEYDKTGTVVGYGWTIFGGDDESNEIGARRRREVALSVLPALRDAEATLRSWRGSPLQELAGLLNIDEADLGAVAQAVADANDHLRDLQEIKDLEDALAQRVVALVGANFAVDVALGVASPEPEEILRMLRLLVEGGRPIDRTGTGAANVVFLAVLLERIKAQRAGLALADAILAVEEPEAHLHPHVQRVLFRYLIANTPLVVTTHSAHIASVAQLSSIVMLQTGPNGTVAHRAVSPAMSKGQIADLERYLDVNRADILFARGVLLVEGAAERYLVPAAAAANDIDLDAAGITVCSVEGTDFAPYRLLLGALGVPHAVITDGDPNDKGFYVGLKRGVELLDAGPEREQAQALLNDEEVGKLDDLLRTYGIFVNNSTLEIEYARTAAASMQRAFDWFVASPLRRKRMGAALAGVSDLHQGHEHQRYVLGRITKIGKGRFAQRAVSYFSAPDDHPQDLRDAVRWLVTAMES